MKRFTLTTLDAAQLGALPAGSVPRFNVAPLQTALIRTADAIAPARWGLLPPWRGHGGKRGPHVVHAPLDQIEATPLLRNARKAGRCLVLADGFFTWRAAPGGKPQPIWHHRADRRPVGLAALSAKHKDDDQLSFAVIGGEDDPPIVIDDVETWLHGKLAAATALLAAAPDAGWRAEPVSTWVNAVGHDDAKCVEPLRNPAQGELF
ncbi:MAG TPA: SOS response-associated peptidase family protein [Kofleriaceae bacterium]|nr:SOS response-associated peptidase family protein [Kofleriaceae bacterium]